jgi:HAD superfamily hydrolase (TIGR01490 family)
VTAAAFFDLDRTLMAGSSAYHFGRAMYKAGQMNRRQITRDAVDQIRFRLEGATDAAVNVLLDRVLEGIKGRRVVDLRRLTPDVLAGILPRVYPQMLTVVREHQDAGRPAFIATAASEPAAEILADALVMDGAMGTRWEVEDGVYTGRLDGPFAYGEGKADRLRQFADERGIDLRQSWAYSDAASDLPMLEAVGHPVAVNPDRGGGGWQRLVAGRPAKGAAQQISGSWLTGRRARAPVGRRADGTGRRRPSRSSPT